MVWCGVCSVVNRKWKWCRSVFCFFRQKSRSVSVFKMRCTPKPKPNLFSVKNPKMSVGFGNRELKEIRSVFGLGKSTKKRPNVNYVVAALNSQHWVCGTVRYGAVRWDVCGLV